MMKLARGALHWRFTVLRRFLAILLPVIAVGQSEAPVGIVRGRVLQITPASITLNTSAGDPVQCGLDSRTYMEREGQRIFSGALRPEDPVELIVDRKAG